MPSSSLPEGLRHPIKLYGQAEGLPNHVIHHILQDSKGFLWVATQEGLACHSGRGFITIPGPKNLFVICLLEDPQGGLWVGTHGQGLFHFQNGKWRSIQAQGKGGFDTVWSLGYGSSPQGQRELLVGLNREGLWCLRGDKLEAVSGPWFQQETVRCLLEVEESPGKPCLWVGTDRKLLARRGEQWDICTPHRGSQPALPISAMAITQTDGKKEFWVGTAQGFFQRQEKGWIEALQLSRTGIIHGLAVQDGNKLWAATDQGLFSGPTSGNDDPSRPGQKAQWTHLDQRAGLQANSMRSVCVTGKGPSSLVWAGSYLGLHRLAQGKFQALNTAAGLPENTVFPITEHPLGTYWFATAGSGICSWKAGRWSRYPKVADRPIPLAPCLLSSSLGFFAGTVDRGLLRFSAGTWQADPINAQLPDQRVWTLLETLDASGKPLLWLGTNRGLIRVASGKLQTFGQAQGLDVEIVMSLAEIEEKKDFKCLWVGTRGGGLYRMLGDRLERVPACRASGVNTIQPILHRDGRTRIWLGTFGSGIVIVDPMSLHAPWKALSTESHPPFPGDQVFSIRQAADGSVYVATNRGVVRLHPDGNLLYVYTSSDGLPSENCTQGRPHLDASGRLWIPTVGGVGVLDTTRQNLDRESKPLVLLGATQGWQREAFPAESLLPHTTRQIRFDFALLSLFREADHRYRIQLQGLDREASPWSSESFKDYSTLPPGQYTFRVWGRDHVGNVSGPTERSFRIDSPPWATWWAYSLYLMGGVGAVIAFVRIRLGLLRKHNRELQERINEATSELRSREQEIQAQAQRLEETNQELQRLNEQKNLFLGLVVHDLRNPLGSIVMASQLLDEDALPLPAREHARQIYQEGMEMSALISRFLDIAAIESGQIHAEEEIFDLGDVARQLLTRHEPKARSKELRILAQVPEGPLPVEADPRFTKEILDNLLSNAIKFSPHGTQITLRIDHLPPVLRISVEDQGPGLNSEDRQRLFGRYARLSASPTGGETSTGLGLSIVKHMVDAMEGRIWVDSEPGQGAAFRVELKGVSQTEGYPSGDGTPREGGFLESSYGSGKILLADDNPSNRRLAAALLRRMGLECLEARDGLEAIEILDSPQGADIRLVFLDGHMPRMDGLTTVKAIRERERNRHLPVMALTGLSNSVEEKAFREGGFDDILFKPVNVNALRTVLDRYLPRTEPPTALLPAWEGWIEALGGEDAFREYLADFVEDAGRRLERLHAALSPLDRTVLERESHDLKSNAAALGFQELAQRCLELERNALLGTALDLKAHVEQIAQSSAAVMSSLSGTQGNPPKG